MNVQFPLWDQALFGVKSLKVFRTDIEQPTPYKTKSSNNLDIFQNLIKNKKIKF